jgi:hypothetical protein
MPDERVVAQRTSRSYRNIAKNSTRPAYSMVCVSQGELESHRRPSNPNDAWMLQAARTVLDMESEVLRGAKLIPIGATMLRRAVREYMQHYHLERNHKGLDNQLIASTPIRQPRPERIESRARLGRHASLL